MVQFILGKLREIMEMARTRYGVNPVVFLVMYVGMGPFWYYTIYRTIRAAAKKNGRDMMLWGAICLIVTVAPYVYVLIFGRNMPWWIYIIIGLIVGQGIYSLVRKLTKKPKAPEAPQAAEAPEAPKAPQPPSAGAVGEGGSQTGTGDAGD